VQTMDNEAAGQMLSSN